jgi:hypothetical protein
MSSNTKNTSDIQLLATYGTLRDDDDSGAAWTKDFVKVSCLFIFIRTLIMFSLIFSRILVVLSLVESLDIVFSVILPSDILLQFLQVL